MAVVYLEKMISVFLVFLLVIRLSLCRKHHVELEDDSRQTIELSKFGFLQHGILSVNFSDLTMDLNNKHKGIGGTFGFSLEKTGSDGISPYMEQHSEKCILTKNASALFIPGNQISLAIITFDLENRHLVISTSGRDFQNLTIVDKSIHQKMVAMATTTLPVSSLAKSSTLAHVATSHNSGPPKDSTIINISKSSKTTSTAEKKLPVTVPTAVENGMHTNLPASTISSENVTTSPVDHENVTSSPPSSRSDNNSPTATHSSAGSPTQQRRRRKRGLPEITQSSLGRSKVQTLPLHRVKNNVSQYRYSGNFVVQIKSKAEEGLYNLYFHNCPSPKAKEMQVTIQIDIQEKNVDNYLSAGEEPLPYMFGVLSVIFFGTAIYWLHLLRKNKEFTYKVHYMMFVLVLLKSLDLMFQSVNYHFISIEGKSPQSWEVLYYITHLLKGALLFTTIVLIGTGYFFIKHVLSDRDKKIFLIVIPLQILANTAQIVMESTEEANTLYTTWKELFILVDLMCCGAILFPVVWSIRHLQEGSQTDGKAALNLAKLKLFRHFYVMIVCYIYFTRIIVYLIKITVPFQYMWLDVFFNNAASYVFFVLTGYKFRPAPDNPYLHVPQEDSDDEVEMEEVLTNAGLANGVTRLQPSSDGKRIFETA
ncbi:protein GPR107-like isoform X1 [Montipora foliosa]|uniref:protein GPR107-like isoform X1 n=1 Tax=Montipora foliosa TaxID=591990 RepID=UPI0035F13BA0